MQKQDGNLIHDLTTGNISRQLITFAAPLFLSGLLQTAYNMVDTIVVGHFVGSAGLSAVNNGGELLMLFTFIAIGFSGAGQIILSQYVGAGRTDSVGPVIGTLCTTMLMVALVATALCLGTSDMLLGWLNTPNEAWEATADYVATCSFGLVFIYGYNVVGAVLRGLGDSKHPFIFVAIASLVNLVLDLLFVVSLGWGVFGAALATVIGQGVSFLWGLVFMYRNRDALGFDFNPASFRIHKDIFSALLKLGIPMALQTAAIAFSKLFITSWINTYGVVASAVTGVGNKLATFVNVLAQALSTAGGSMIAQNIGAEKYERVPKILSTSFLLNGAVTAVLTMVTALWPRVVFGLFTSDAAVLDMAVVYLPVALLQYASAVLRPPMNALINGSGNARMNLAIAILDGVVARIGLALLMGLVFQMGIYGFWYGNTLAGFVPFFIGGAYYLSGRWKTNRYLIHD